MKFEFFSLVQIPVSHSYCMSSYIIVSIGHHVIERNLIEHHNNHSTTYLPIRYSLIILPRFICMESKPVQPTKKARVLEFFRKFFKYTGPGWLMSLAYLDPGNLEADLQAGAYTGYQLLWILLLAHIIGFVMQILAARLGAVSGKHLAEVCREKYSRGLSVFLWVMTELAIIGSDVQEVVGTAIALQVLLGIPMWAGVLITAADTFTFLAVHYMKGVRAIEIIIFALILVMMTCFFINFGIISPWAGDVFSGFLPSNMHHYATLQAVAIIGAVIMPHNIYLHSALVTEKNVVDRSNTQSIKEANYFFTLDSAIALTVSFVVNLALLSSFASGFFAPTCSGRMDADGSITNLGCLVGLPQADDSVCPATDPSCLCFNSIGQSGFCAKIGLEEASSALEGLLGSYAKYIFALGLFAAGQASTLTGTFAGQFVMSGFMRFNVAVWIRTLITRLIAIGPALVIAICQSAIPSLGEASEWLNVLQSVQLPFAILPLLHFSIDTDVMTSDFALKSKWKIGVLWLITFGIIGVNFFLVVSHITPMNPAWWAWVIFALVGIAYLYMCFKCIESDLVRLCRFFGLYRRPKEQEVSEIPFSPKVL
jgi:NRAMP (natural resistance-associated macrophage protein)-like metal ion transporter